MKKILSWFSPTTKELRYSKEIDTNLLGNNIPNTTEKDPLEPKENFAILFISNSWEYVEDNRGKDIHNIETKEDSICDYIGAIKEGFVLGKYIKTTSEVLKESKDLKLNSLRVNYDTDSLKELPYKSNTYKGGDSSASAIAGAVSLAQSLGETNCKIVDIKDVSHELTFGSANTLSALIAKQWRDTFFKYKALKVDVSKATTIEQINQIKW